MLRSVLVSRVGASHRINLIVRSPLGQNCPRKNVYVTIEENTRNSQLIQLPGVSYLNHGICMPGIVCRLFFFHPQFTCGYYFTCTLSSGTKNCSVPAWLIGNSSKPGRQWQRKRLQRKDLMSRTIAVHSCAL